MQKLPSNVTKHFNAIFKVVKMLIEYCCLPLAQRPTIFESVLSVSKKLGNAADHIKLDSPCLINTKPSLRPMILLLVRKGVEEPTFIK